MGTSSLLPMLRKELLSGISVSPKSKFINNSEIKKKTLNFFRHKIRYGYDNESCMCVRFNRNGDSVLVIRKRLPPVLYNTLESEAVCQFYHTDYYNSCTMKSCCFAGPNDEYILSGSDDFNLYIWSLENCKCESNISFHFSKKNI